MIARMSPQLPPSDISWCCQPFAELPPHPLYALLRLRVDVFVVEQACAYPELDGKDLIAGAHHLYGRDSGGVLLACARLLPAGVSFELPSIGRVAVAAPARGSGLGHVLMQQALWHAGKLWPGQPLALAAQAHLRRYYERHGFVVCSESYLEDGIPHLDMQRPADPEPLPA
jgi:ElaA protein